MMKLCSRAFAGFLLVSLAAATGAAQAGEGAGDLRGIRTGMMAAELPKDGFANMSCATSTAHKLAGWSDWRDCPAEAGSHAIRFGYDPATDPEGTMVAGHPAILTLMVDEAGRVVRLQIDTDPKTRLYLRKKAFLLGVQAKSRYGVDGWACIQTPAAADEMPVGGVYLKEQCRKTTNGRTIDVARNLFRHAGQDMKSFVDETRISIALAKE